MAIEAIKRFFGRSPETENPELLTTADKLNNEMMAMGAMTESSRGANFEPKYITILTRTM